MRRIIKIALSSFGIGVVFLIIGVSGNRWVSAEVNLTPNPIAPAFAIAIFFGFFFIVLSLVMFILAGMIKK